jgi:hypothetical protein
MVYFKNDRVLRDARAASRERRAAGIDPLLLLSQCRAGMGYEFQTLELGAACKHERGGRMRRRDFIHLTAGAALAWPLSAGAQLSQRSLRLGMLGFLPRSTPILGVLESYLGDRQTPRLQTAGCDGARGTTADVLRWMIRSAPRRNFAHGGIARQAPEADEIGPKCRGPRNEYQKNAAARRQSG